MYRIREEKKRGTWTLPYGQTLKLIYLICTISYLHCWPSIARSAKSMILHPRESYILKQIVCLSICLFVEVLKPRSLLKLSPRTRRPKNYSGPQSHTFISLLTESQVPRAQKLFRTSITHFYFFTYRVSSPEGPKTIQDLNHTLLLLYLPSPESWVLTNPGPNAQASNYLLRCLRSKSRMVKKSLVQAGRRPGVWNRRSKY